KFAKVLAESSAWATQALNRAAHAALLRQSGEISNTSEIELSRDLHHARKVPLTLRQLSERGVIDVRIGTGANRRIGDIECLPTEQEFVALIERKRLGESQVQLRLLRLTDVRESIRSRSHVERRKLLVATLLVVEPLILILVSRLPCVAIVSKIRPADR